MSETKPIKLDQGKLAQFTSGDQLPNQVDIDYLRNLFGRLLVQLEAQGFVLQDEFLLEELNYATKNIIT